MTLLTRTQHMGIAALIMSASILLSRFMGLIRDKVISWQFGTSGEADLYFAAFVVPDFINYLLAGGYVSITLIPLLAQRFGEDRDDAWRFFSSVFWWALFVASLLTCIAWVWAPELARISAPGFTDPQHVRLTYFLRIILPAQIFFLSGACFSALLFLRRQFFIPALTPLIYNGCIILGGLLLPVSGMEGFCWGVTAGAALGAWLLPAWAVYTEELHLQAVWRHPLMGRFLLIALPLMLGQSVVMLNEQFLRIFGSMAGDGAVSLLSYARRISQVPVGFIGQAAAVASYPFLASLAAKNDTDALNNTLRTALCTSLIVAIPITAWMLATANPVMSLIFEGGNFGAAQTAAATPLLVILLCTIPFWIVQAVVGRAFYALGDTKTPALLGTLITIASVPFFYVSLRWGAMGIAWVSTAGAVAYNIVLCMIWRKRQQALYPHTHVLLYAKSLVCASLAAMGCYAASLCTQGYLQHHIIREFMAIVVSGITFATLYIALAYLLRSPELIRPLLLRIPFVRRFVTIKNTAPEHE